MAAAQAFYGVDVAEGWHWWTSADWKERLAEGVRRTAERLQKREFGEADGNERT